MRRKLVSALVGTTLLLGACGGGGSGTAQSNSPAGAPATLQAVMSDEAKELNPLLPTGQGKSQILSTIGTRALYVTPDGEVTSKILDSWDVSPDAKTVTLKLKTGLKWSDGQPITSKDLLYTYNTYLNSKISSGATRLSGVEGAKEVADGKADKVSGLSAPDPQTMVVKLATPNAAWVGKLAHTGPFLPLLPEHILGKVPAAELANNAFFQNWPVSGGPYTLTKFVQGQYVEVKRNDQYTITKPAFEKIIFQTLSTDQMTAKLQTGELHYIYTVDPSDVDRVSKIAGVTVAEHHGSAPELFGINNGKPHFKDPRVRQALLYAIDRENICKTILAGKCTTPLTNLRQIGPEWSIPTEGLTSYNYNPDEAKRLLKEAGWDPATKLTLLARNQRSYVEKAVTAAAGQLKAAGFDVTIRNTTSAKIGEELEADNWDLFWVSGANFIVDPAQWADYLKCEYKFPKGANTAKYCNPEVDKLLDAGVATADQAERAKAYKQAFTLVNKDPAEVYLYTVDMIVAHNSHLTGVKAASSNGSEFLDIDTWGWSN